LRKSKFFRLNASFEAGLKLVKDWSMAGLKLAQSWRKAGF
jgi:hypothetical protein